SVLLVLFWRFLLITLLLAPFSIRYVVAAGIRPFWINTLLGFCGMFLQLGCAVVAIDMGIPAGTLSIIYSLQPLVTAAVAGPLLGEHVTARQWVGLAIAFIGVLIAAGFDGFAAPWVAYLLTVLGTAGIVAATVIAKVSQDNTPLIPAIGIQSSATAALFL